jgi:hypothetical protein
MKKLFFALCLMLFSIPAFAQNGVSTGVGPPIGSCAGGNPAYIDTSTGYVYSCKNGAWVSVGASFSGLTNDGTTLTYSGTGGVAVTAGPISLKASAVSAPISLVTDNNTGLGPNTSENFAHWASINEQNGTNCGGASIGNGWNWYKYGDGSGGLQEYCNGQAQSGWHLDVGSASGSAPSGRAELYGGLGGFYTNE